MRNSSRRYSLVTPRRTIECALAHASMTFSTSGERSGSRPVYSATLTTSFVAQRLRRVQDDRLAGFEARLDPGQVVVGHGDLDLPLRGPSSLPSTTQA